jgi:hypothetical protein
VFVVQGYDTINASITLDSTVILNFPDNVMYNVQFYNSPTLSLTNHILNISLQTWGVNGAQSSMLFDYAVVALTNDAGLSPQLSFSPLTTSSPTQASSLVSSVTLGS